MATFKIKDIVYIGIRRYQVVETATNSEGVFYLLNTGDTVPESFLSTTPDPSIEIEIIEKKLAKLNAIEIADDPIPQEEDDFTILYPINSMVFFKSKAYLGKLDRVTIKKFYINNRGNVYKDTTNRLWVENELVPHSVAVPIAIDYYERQLASLEN